MTIKDLNDIYFNSKKVIKHFTIELNYEEKKIFLDSILDKDKTLPHEYDEIETIGTGKFSIKIINKRMSKFKEYRRKNVSEMREVTQSDIANFNQDSRYIHSLQDHLFKVSISQADLDNGSPKIGDMIARNPKNHEDQWLVAKEYFNDNLELI